MKIHPENEIPKLNPMQCSVIQAELKTGILLNIDGERHRKDLNQPYILIFSSFEDAKVFCERKVKENTNTECCIYNHLAEFVEVIRY
jgi:hypothetical protein